MSLRPSPARARRRRLASFAILSAGLTFHLAIQAAPRPQAPKSRRRLHAYRLEQPVELDGLVKEDFWARMEPATDFVQQMPQEGQPSSERTEVRVAFDNKTLYFAVICFDREPDRILVTQNKRDGDLIDCDSFQILLDTFNDGQNGFVFGTNPRGIEYDGQVTKGGQSGGSSFPAPGSIPSSAQPTATSGSASTRATRGPTGSSRSGSSSFNINWDGVWQVRAQITARGWEAEFAIPFKTLRFNPAGQTWGVNFQRNIRRHNEQAHWSPIPRAFDVYRVSLAGQVEGIEPTLHRSTQFIPYVLGGVSQNFLDRSDPTKGVHKGGLDVKYTLSSSLALDITVKPDFAQVEVDEEQVNLTQFNLFFPEKRPFFLENAGLFEFGAPRDVEIFFSRQIGIDPSGVEVPVLAGARVTGKIQKFSVGLLDMQTESVNRLIPANNFSVARIRREFGHRSAFGGIFVGKVATGDLAAERHHNETIGFDANLGFGERLTLYSYIAKSHTTGKTGRTHAGRALLEYNSGLIEARAGYAEVGEDFNPEAGFLRRAGYRKPEWGFYYYSRPKWGPIRRLIPHITGEQFFDFSGNRFSGVSHNDFRIEFHDGSEISLAKNFYFDRLDKPFKPFPGVVIPPGRYPHAEWSLACRTNSSAPLFLGGSWATGGYYDGTLTSYSLSGGVRNGSNFLASFRWLRNGGEVASGRFLSTLAQLRLDYSFTAKSYIQTLIQFNNQNHQISGNFRFAYLLTSSAGLFVVYNTHLDTLWRGVDDFHRRTMDRALLVKFSYLFRL